MATAAAAQRPVKAGAATTVRIPRTSDGHPDLEGVWTYGTYTPFERPAPFADKPFFSGEEADKFHRVLAAAAQGAVEGRFIQNLGDRDRPFLIVDGRELTSVIQDPPNGRVPELTPEAQRRFRALTFDRLDSAKDAPLYERCIKSASWPPLLPGTVYPNLQVVQTPTHIALVQEDQYGTRLITTNGTPRVNSALASWLGDSRGRWDGDTLVIETVNFRDQIQQRPLSSRFDGNLRLVERLTLVSDRLLRYDFLVDDPTIFVKPWGGVMMLRKTDSSVYEVACHEGNYSLANMLRAARVRDSATDQPEQGLTQR